MKTLVRTHGGLGNQLFQVFYARLHARHHLSRALIVLHDMRYAHRFDLSTRFRLLASRPSILERALSSIRIPKLISRSRMAAVESFSLLGTTYLDGYFQDPNQYLPFTDADLRDEMQSLQSEFGVDRRTMTESHLVHLRLGDFFGDEASQIRHLEERLRALPGGSHVITNRDDLLERRDYRAALERFECRHIPTTGMLAEQVLSLMCRYREIESNNSTLAFWASALTGSDVSFSLENLVRLRQRLLKAYALPLT